MLSLAEERSSDEDEEDVIMEEEKELIALNSQLNTMTLSQNDTNNRQLTMQLQEQQQVGPQEQQQVGPQEQQQGKPQNQDNGNESLWSDMQESNPQSHNHIVNCNICDWNLLVDLEDDD